jgi:hypothetical protein
MHASRKYIIHYLLTILFNHSASFLLRSLVSCWQAVAHGCGSLFVKCKPCASLASLLFDGDGSGARTPAGSTYLSLTILTPLVFKPSGEWC